MLGTLKVGERLGCEFVIDSRPGAAGQLGLEQAARAVPDGYAISMGQGTNLAKATDHDGCAVGDVSDALIECGVDFVEHSMS